MELHHCTNRPTLYTRTLQIPDNVGRVRTFSFKIPQKTLDPPLARDSHSSLSCSTLRNLFDLSILLCSHARKSRWPRTSPAHTVLLLPFCQDPQQSPGKPLKRNEWSQRAAVISRSWVTWYKARFVFLMLDCRVQTICVNPNMVNGPARKLTVKGGERRNRFTCHSGETPARRETSALFDC